MGGKGGLTEDSLGDCESDATVSERVKRGVKSDGGVWLDGLMEEV